MNLNSSNSDAPRPRGPDAEELSRAKDRLIQSRAARLGITPAEAESLLDAERQTWNAAAPADDDDVDQALADLEESEYPSPECLDPHEVEEAALGRLSDDRQGHASQCPFCRTLLDMAVPTKARVDEFLDEVRETCTAAGLVPDDFALAGADADSWSDRGHARRRGVPVATKLVLSGSGVLAGAAATLLAGFFAIQSGWPAARQFEARERSGPRAQLSSMPVDESMKSRIDHLGEFLTSQPSEGVKAITLSPDQERMAVVKNDGSVILWDPTAKQRVREFTTDQGTSALAPFSEDSQWFIASGTQDGDQALEASAHVKGGARAPE